MVAADLCNNASQRVLDYRDHWITDVPEAFALSTEQLAGLDVLVGVHLVTLALVTIALRYAAGSAR